MAKHTFIIRGDSQRDLAKKAIDQAPIDYVVTLAEPKRTKRQNDYMWALLTEISIAKPEGRTATPEVWKTLVMNACGHEVQFEMGLNGLPFPVGFSTSKLSTAEMNDLLEWIHKYAAEQGVVFNTPKLVA